MSHQYLTSIAQLIHNSLTPAGALSTYGDELAHRWNMLSEAGALLTCRDEVAYRWNMFSDVSKVTYFIT